MQVQPLLPEPYRSRLIGKPPGSEPGKWRFEPFLRCQSQRNTRGLVPRAYRRGSAAEARSACTRQTPVRLRLSALDVTKNTKTNATTHSPVAQLAERSTVNRVGAGASPARGARNETSFSIQDGGGLQNRRAGCNPREGLHARIQLTAQAVAFSARRSGFDSRCEHHFSAIGQQPVRRSFKSDTRGQHPLALPRDVAQPGRAPGLEPEGRPFKSAHPDRSKNDSTHRGAGRAFHRLQIARSPSGEQRSPTIFDLVSRVAAHQRVA